MPIPSEPALYNGMRIVVGSVTISIRQDGREWLVRAAEHGHVVMKFRYKERKDAVAAYNRLVRAAYDYLRWVEMKWTPAV